MRRDFFRREFGAGRQIPPLEVDFEKLECLEFMSGISLCAMKQRYTLIYFDGGEDFFLVLISRRKI